MGRPEGGAEALANHHGNDDVGGPGGERSNIVWDEPINCDEEMADLDIFEC